MLYVGEAALILKGHVLCDTGKVTAVAHGCSMNAFVTGWGGIEFRLVRSQVISAQRSNICTPRNDYWTYMQIPPVLFPPYLEKLENFSKILITNLKQHISYLWTDDIIGRFS